MYKPYWGVTVAVVAGLAGTRASAAADPSTANPPPDGWWKSGAKACPSGGHLDGGPPPGGRRVLCKRADYVEHGPAAAWDDTGHLLSLGAYLDGKMTGRWTYFYPSGKKHREGGYRAGEQHGRWLTWRDDGSVFLEENFLDGRPDGEQIARAADGQVLKRWSLRNGTGTRVYWNDDGTEHAEESNVDGKADGPFISWHPNGQVAARGRFVAGEEHGVVERYSDQGVLVAREIHDHGKPAGDWKRFDGTGAQSQLVRYASGEEVFELGYQDGAPLVPVPAPSACDARDGLRRAAFGGAAPKDQECLERMRHFPGVARVGRFAFDRGCIAERWLVDCKPTRQVSSTQLLARAGWAKARGAAREALAMAYVTEVVLSWQAMVQDEPDRPAAHAAPDGSVTVTAWTAPPSGMSPETTVTITQERWTFGPGGAMTHQPLKTQQRPR